MKRRFWYATKKIYGKLRIYYRLEKQEVTQFYFTDTTQKGNKRVGLERTLMRNNWPIITKKIYSIPSSYSELNGLRWKEEEEERIINFLRRGNPNDDARSDLFTFFGYSIFDLTSIEREYFTSGFPNIDRLVSFYHAIKKECRNRGTGYTHRMFKGRSIIITPGKIKKAMMILFKADPKEVLYGRKV